MTRRFIAALVTAALALTGLSAVPARADGDDAVRAILGLAALYAIAKTIEKNNDDRRKPPPVAVFRKPVPHKAPGPYGTQRHGRYLPTECLRRVETRHGSRHIFMEHCLRREGVRHLPQACEIRVKGHGGKTTAYNARCLQRSGFRLEPEWR